MEKKEDHKLASATTHEPDSNDLGSKEEQNQTSVTFGVKNIGASSPSPDDNTTCLDQQYPSVLQLPHVPQNNVEQPSSSSKPCVSSQSPPSIAVSQWHQLPHLQLNPGSHQGHPLPHLAQSSTPFWLSQCPGYHFPGVNAPAIVHPFTPIKSNWPASGLIGGESLSKDHPQVPNLCYHAGYTYPGFPGPWDPSSWWGQVQLSQPPFPGAYGCFSSQPSKVPGCSTQPSLGQSSQRGIIRPVAKLSQKHQELWEAQSAENVQLWTVVGQLQSDIAYQKCLIMKLEAEVSSLKQVTEVPTVHDSGTVVSRKPSKRGRPRKTVASVDTLPSPVASEPRIQGRKPKVPIFQKVILKKAENTVKPSNQPAISQQKEKNFSAVIANGSSDIGNNGSNITVPSFNNQVHQESSQMKLSGVGLVSRLETEINDDKTEITNDAFAVLNQQAKGMYHRPALASSLAAKNNRGNGWPYSYTITSEGNGRNILNTSLHGFGNSGSVIRQSEKVIPGWSLMNEDVASEDLEDVIAASAKDENEEEMRDDDGSSGSEEISCS